tara:strand:+ start:519 stop:752 length:234 start_codon:yes stop_codon:yes gene_type:complete
VLEAALFLGTAILGGASLISARKGLHPIRDVKYFLLSHSVTSLTAYFLTGVGSFSVLVGGAIAWVGTNLALELHPAR